MRLTTRFSKSDPNYWAFLKFSLKNARHYVLLWTERVNWQSSFTTLHIWLLYTNIRNASLVHWRSSFSCGKIAFFPPSSMWNYEKAAMLSKIIFVLCFKPNYIINVMLCAICYHLYSLEDVKNTCGGVLLLVTKNTFLHRYSSRFLNCTNATKLRKASQMWKITQNLWCLDSKNFSTYF